MEVGGVEPKNGDFQHSGKRHKNHDNNNTYTSHNQELKKYGGTNKIYNFGQVSDTEKHLIDSFRAQYKHNEIPIELIKLVKSWSNIPEAVSKGILAMVDCYIE